MTQSDRSRNGYHWICTCVLHVCYESGHAGSWPFQLRSNGHREASGVEQAELFLDRAEKPAERHGLTVGRDGAFVRQPRDAGRTTSSESYRVS